MSAIGTQGLGLNMNFLDLAGLYQSVLVDATTNGGAKIGRASCRERVYVTV